MLPSSALQMLLHWTSAVHMTHYMSNVSCDKLRLLFGLTEGRKGIKIDLLFHM